MECYKCGKDIGSGLGLCVECRVKRASEPREGALIGSTARKASATPLVSLLSRSPGLLFGVVVLPIALILLIQSAQDNPIRMTQKGGAITLIDDATDSRVVYRAGQTTRIAGRVLDWNPQKLSFSSGASRGILVLLSDEDWKASFSVKGCKAAFYNQHSQVYMVVPRSQAESDLVRAAGWSSGDKVSLIATALEPVEVRFQGNDMNPGNWFSNVRKISVSKLLD